MYNRGHNNKPKKSIKKDIMIAAHDLNNLLNNILNGIELLKENTLNNDSADRLINHIEKNTILASDIVKQISSENNSSGNSKSPIELNSVLIETIELLNKDYKNLIHLDGIGKPIKIWGNFTNIKRVFLNILNNAKQSSPKKGIITIKLESNSPKNPEEKEIVKISITDKGCGISQDNLIKIFDEGFSTKENSSNRGLGLSIVKNIVEDHSGKIEVESLRNEGSTFKLSFPVYSENQDAKFLENKNVVIAEDDEFQREVLKDLLKSLKLNVFTASNGIEALELYASTKPDLMFIDNNMPGLTGLECTEKIKNIDKSSQVILVTGSNIDIVNENVSKVLKKPYSFEMIETIIKELI